CRRFSSTATAPASNGGGCRTADWGSHARRLQRPHGAEAADRRRLLRRAAPRRPAPAPRARGGPRGPPRPPRAPRRRPPRRPRPPPDRPAVRQPADRLALALGPEGIACPRPQVGGARIGAPRLPPPLRPEALRRLSRAEFHPHALRRADGCDRPRFIRDIA